jgi:hypothetical protein
MKNPYVNFSLKTLKDPCNLHYKYSVTENRFIGE